MYIFWNNVIKFPRFFISVLLGFILTTFNTIIKLLNNPKKNLVAIIIISFLYTLLIKTLKLMLAIN